MKKDLSRKFHVLYERERERERERGERETETKTDRQIQTETERARTLSPHPATLQHNIKHIWQFHYQTAFFTADLHVHQKRTQPP